MRSESRRFRLVHSQARANAADAVMNAPEGFTVTISPPARSADQNDAQWPILNCFAAQKKWCVNGEYTYMTPEEWKDILTAAFREDTIRLASGLSGGVVMLGARTSKMSKTKFSEWLEFLHATAEQMGVDVDQG